MFGRSPVSTDLRLQFSTKGAGRRSSQPKLAICCLDLKSSREADADALDFQGVWGRTLKSDPGPLRVHVRRAAWLQGYIRTIEGTSI